MEPNESCCGPRITQSGLLRAWASPRAPSTRASGVAKAGLPAAGVRILCHSAAKLRRDAGEPIEDVSRFLDHFSLQVTTVYLRSLEGQEDKSWWQMAEALGV